MEFEKIPSDFEGESPGYESQSPNYLKEFFQWIMVIIIALVVALLMKAFIFELVLVEGPSMQNTMFTGQKLVVYKLGYQFTLPERGDIIVLKYQEGEMKSSFFNKLPILKKIFPPSNEVDYIKRVIALPGDEIDLREGFVYVNQKKIEEPYVKAYGRTFARKNMDFEFPVKVPANKLIALGDNREESKDSREIGYIDIKQIKGKAVFRVWPLSDFGSLK
ncbi:MAG: signal peptidase I [Clostridia bacterium]|nr:signal peptidase I [Clostridia bacterium]